MKKSFFVIFVLFGEVACATTSATKRPEAQHGHQVGEVDYTLAFAKSLLEEWPHSDREVGKKLIQDIANENRNSLEQDQVAQREVREALKAGGKKALQSLGLKHGLLVYFDEIERPAILFRIVGTVPSGLRVTPILVTEAGFFSDIVEIDQRNYMVMSLARVGRDITPPSRESTDFLLRLFRSDRTTPAELAKAAQIMTVVAATRVSEECGYKSYDELAEHSFVWTSEALQRLNENPPSVTASTGFLASSMIAALVSHPQLSQCPWALHLTFQSGFNYDAMFVGSRSVAAVNLAYLGRTFALGGTEGSTSSIPATLKWLWTFLKQSNKDEALAYLRTLGQSSDEWGRVRQFSDAVFDSLDADSAQRFARRSARFGLQSTKILASLPSIEVADHRDVGVQVEAYDGDSYAVRETFRVQFSAADANLAPPLSSTVKGIDACATPVLWSRGWWRVCP